MLVSKNRTLCLHKKVMNSSSEDIKFLCSKIEKIHLGNTVTIIGISGGSASGKTSTITPAIEKYLNKKYSVKVLNMDNFQMGKKFVESLHSPYKYDDKRNFNFCEIKDSLTKLKQGCDVDIPTFSLETVSRSGKSIFKSGDIILLEGIYATDEVLQNLLDLTMYVDDEVANMLAKRILRYSLEMNLKNGASGALKQYIKYVLPAHYDMVSLQKNTANIILLNNFDPFFLIRKFELKEQEKKVFAEKDILFAITSKYTEIIVTYQSCYINFFGKSYFNFQINNELMEILKKKQFVIKYKKKPLVS